MIEEARKEIDKIDTQIVTLLAQRIEIARNLGTYKKERDIPVQNIEREEQLLIKLKDLAMLEKVDPTLIGEIYNTILEHSREVQYNA